MGNSKQTLLFLFCTTAVLFGCTCRSKTNTQASFVLQESKVLEPLSKHSIVHSSINDGPSELLQLNLALEEAIQKADSSLNEVYSQLLVHAKNGNCLSEFSKAHKSWLELREQDSLVAAKGEHGYTLARHLYLKEKLEYTESRV